MSEPNDFFVVTANFTDDGAPAYLTSTGDWSRRLQDAAVAEEDRQRAVAAQRAADDQRAVCDPYIFKVAVSDGVIDPVSTRENIRASGPTTRLRRPD